MRTTRYCVKLEPRFILGSDGKLDWNGNWSRISKARVFSQNTTEREQIPLVAPSPIFLLPSQTISTHDCKLDTSMQRIKNVFVSFPQLLVVAT